MNRSRSFRALALLAALAGSPARGHELWFQPVDPKAPGVVRLTFGDSPAPGEAERVAEIAHARVWAAGRPVEVERLPDGLEARRPAGDAPLLSAYADRGVVDHLGDSFIITLAAYAQAGPLGRGEAPKLGLDDDQLRLLLVSGEGGGPPVVRATWKGKPAADVAVKVFRGTAEFTELRTDANGEVPCPDLKPGGVSLLAQVVAKVPGRRDGKSYSETRHKATLCLDGAGR